MYKVRKKKTFYRTEYFIRNTLTMENYAENFYNYLKRKGYDAKYEHAGIYCIKIDDKIVYIGKSSNMLRRVA